MKGFMKIFSREQLAKIDRRTREEEPIAEVDLMERASVALSEWLMEHYPASTRIAIFAGPGNNGGDALAMARMLSHRNYKVSVYLPTIGRQRSEASQINLTRLMETTPVPHVEIGDPSELPELSVFDLVVDGLFGSGLNRPLEGFAAIVIDHINRSAKEVVAIDLPSGLLCDENRFNNGAIVKATHTLSLEFPKLSLFFRENEPYFGKWEVVKFGLSQQAIREVETLYTFLDQQQVASILKRRTIFSHKGSYGHGLLISGSKGKMGAALLASRGALRAGLGLLTVHLPKFAGLFLQGSLPEAMSSYDKQDEFLSELPDLSAYAAVAAGPGIGTHLLTAGLISTLIDQAKVPMVLDADALNILAANPAWLKRVPPNTILTPHPMEFDRLAGIVSRTEEERLAMAEHFSSSYGLILVLKGAFTRIIFPEGGVAFNSTGNPGMATGGSGDVLTGILLGLLSQGYTPREAALLGVFLHGRSADLRVATTSEESLIASEIADYLGDAFASLK
jgi:NAD(P)H-hydrate epimerase